MTDLRQAAKQALEEWRTEPGSVRMASLMMALQRALAEDAMDKMAENARELGLDYGCPNCASLMEQNTELDKKLSEWVGLTKEEIEKCKFDSLNGTGWALSVDINLFYKSVEAKLKEKNR